MFRGIRSLLLVVLGGMVAAVVVAYFLSDGTFSWDAVSAEISRFFGQVRPRGVERQEITIDTGL
jgi:hypothetical protein